MSLLGRALITFLTYLGQLGGVFGETMGYVFRGRWRPRLVGQQIVNIGFGSQAVVIVTGAFTGAVFTAQVYYLASQYGMETSVGGVVSIAVCRELAPVIVGLMLTGRVGAAMAAEIGTMKVTEQVDALRAMGVSPNAYLVVPRMIAMVVSVPLLIAEAILFGIVSSYIVGVTMNGISAPWFMNHLDNYTQLEDIAFGMIKGFVFGVLICLIACHQGLVARNGAVGVGRGTTKAVVISSLAILIFNFFLTIVLTMLFPFGEG